MASVPTGSTQFVASAFSASKPVTGISNAAEGVVSCTGHGFTAGDTILLTSGWGRINQRPFRVKAPTTDAFTLEGEDTTRVDFFPPGSGGGSVVKVNTFTQIVQIVGISSSGGDPKTVEYKYMEGDAAGSINDGFASTQTTLEMDADSIGTPGYAALKTLTAVQTTTVIKTTLRNGSTVLRAGTVALNEDPSMQDGQINKVKCVINGNGRVTRYGA